MPETKPPYFLTTKSWLSKNFSYFCRALVRRSRFGKAIKRESGENPEQSRCCKFHKALPNYPMPLETIRFREGVGNGNKSEDLPCNTLIIAFEEKALSLMSRTLPSIISFIIT